MACLYITAPQPLTRHTAFSVPRHRPFNSSTLGTGSIEIDGPEQASGLDRLHAVPTRVKPAVPALPDEPERAGMADVAGP